MSATTQFRPLIPFKAGAAVAKHKIVKPGAADDRVVQAADAGDKIIGVTDRPAAAAGDPVDVAVIGEVPVECGAAVTRGDLLTSDANGKAVPTTTAGNAVLGRALRSGADGDIIPVLLSLGSV